MLGMHIVDDEIMIDDPDIIGQLQELGKEWGCTPEEAFRRVMEREAARRASLEAAE